MFTTIIIGAALATGAPAAAEPVKDKKVCRNVKELHSRIGRRVCRSSSEWAAEADAAREGLRNRNRNHNPGNPSS